MSYPCHYTNPVAIDASVTTYPGGYFEDATSVTTYPGGYHAYTQTVLYGDCSGEYWINNSTLTGHEMTDADDFVAHSKCTKKEAAFLEALTAQVEAVSASIPPPHATAAHASCMKLASLVKAVHDESSS